jgi:RimK family alpha-L-glutamate ligase
MKVAIFSDETGWHTRRLQAALRARGAQGRCVDLAACDIDLVRGVQGLRIPGFGERLPDAAIVRGIAGGSFEQVTKRLGVLHALRELGVAVVNDARAIERSVDKSMSSLLLHAAGVATPPAWAIESAQAAQRLVMRESAARRALVLKPLFGSQGHGLQRVGWVDDGRGGAHVPLPDLGQGYGRLAYLQRFVPGQDHDWRVLVIGGHARAAMQRVAAAPGRWIHNIAQGARPVRAVLTADLARLAEAASGALGLDYAGVDLIPTPAGPQVLEVNGVAAWQGLQRVTAFDIAQALVDDLLDRRLARRRRA